MATSWIGWLWENLGRTGGPKLLSAFLTRNAEATASAKRIELLVVAQAEREAEEIRSNLKSVSDFPLKLKFKADAGAEDAGLDVTKMLFEAATIDLVHDTLRRECNIARAISFAEDRLEDETGEVPKESIDLDWLYNWRDLAGKVSTEAMQQLWGSVLAGELKSPGRYSLRCLDVLKSLTVTDARRIEEFAPYVILEDFVWFNSLDRKHSHPPFELCVQMAELGLITGIEAAQGMTYTPPCTTSKVGNCGILRCYQKAILLSGVTSKSVAIPCYFVTEIGGQILSLLSGVEADITYLELVGKSLKRNAMTVHLADVLPLDSINFKILNSVEL